MKRSILSFDNFENFQDGANGFVVGLNIGLVCLRLSEQIIGINRDADPVGPFSGLARWC